MKAKNPLQKYKPYLEHGKLFTKSNPSIAFAIKNYAITNIYKEYKTNKNSLNESEVSTLESLVKELSSEKKELGEKAQVTAEEFADFIETLFANVDEEDRTKEITMKTSASFKIVADLIDILSTWGPLSEEMQKASKIHYLIFLLIG
jgi:hypothetical protein